MESVLTEPVWVVQKHFFHDVGDETLLDCANEAQRTGAERSLPCQGNQAQRLEQSRTDGDGTMTTRNHWRKYAVDAESVKDFLDRYYKPDRYTGRGEEYAAALLKSYQEEVDECGYTFISHHDCVRGEMVAWYPEEGARGQMAMF
jgi:hypothetical protein